MTTTPPVATDIEGSGHGPGEHPLPPGHEERRATLPEILVAVAVIVLVGVATVLAFGYLKDEDASNFLKVVIAILVGGVGIWALYWAFDRLVAALPRAAGNALRPVVFVGPALALLAFYLVYPAINTLFLSFRDADGESWVGFDNFERLFTERQYQIGIRNSIVWALVVPGVAVAVGLLFATLADKLGRRTESVAKSLIFMPMAISFVGASVVWGFVYNFRPEGFGDQIGLLNGIWTALGNDPVEWLAQKPWNNLYLMVILIWLQVGFSMVVLSSAIKGVPDDLLEAARIDGATEWQIFWRIIVPTIASTIVVVWTTVLITVWKVFDIVWVTTGGRDDTQVIAQQMVQEFFTFNNDGIGAALAVVLFIAVTPVLLVNIRRFQAQEAQR